MLREQSNPVRFERIMQLKRRFGFLPRADSRKIEKKKKKKKKRDGGPMRPSCLYVSLRVAEKLMRLT